MNKSGPLVTIGTCAAMSMVLGTVHAFSVFIPEWERMENASRASISLVYSLALVSLTVAVLLGPAIYDRLRPVTVFLISGLLAALGLALSARTTTLFQLYITYGVIFGAANGLGYGYTLQLAGQTATVHRGLAMGLVTAFYAVGATLAPLLFVLMIARSGNSLALLSMSFVVLMVTILSASLLIWTGAEFKASRENFRIALSPKLERIRFKLWMAYGSAVAAGLMIIGHAYGVAQWLNLSVAMAGAAPALVSLGNMLGGFCAGYFSDRWSSLLLIRWLPLLTIAGLSALLVPLNATAIFVLLALGLVGYCYGAIIAVYPVAVVDLFGTDSAAVVYGQVFTAWGLAGLLGPWFSGWIFDNTGSYFLPILIALLLSGFSAICARGGLTESTRG